MSIERQDYDPPARAAFGRWEDALLDVLADLPRPCRGSTVATYACAKLWPPPPHGSSSGARPHACSQQVSGLLDRLARNGHVQRWEPGTRYPCDLWTRSGRRWEIAEDAMYATIENALRWEASAERTEAEHHYAERLARRLIALTGWQHVDAPTAEPTIVSLRLTLDEAEELLASYAEGCSRQA